MTFITESDYKAIVSQEDLDDLTDLETTKRTSAEDTAISLAADHLNARYDVPNIFNKTGADRQPSVVWVVVGISTYLMHQSIHPNAVPDHRVFHYKEAMKWLEKVKAAEINPLGLPLLEDGSKDYILTGGEVKEAIESESKHHLKTVLEPF